MSTATWPAAPYLHKTSNTDYFRLNKTSHRWQLWSSHRWTAFQKAYHSFYLSYLQSSLRISSFHSYIQSWKTSQVWVRVARNISFLAAYLFGYSFLFNLLLFPVRIVMGSDILSSWLNWFLLFLWLSKSFWCHLLKLRNHFKTSVCAC